MVYDHQITNILIIINNVLVVYGAEFCNLCLYLLGVWGVGKRVKQSLKMSKFYSVWWLWPHQRYGRNLILDNITLAGSSGLQQHFLLDARTSAWPIRALKSISKLLLSKEHSCFIGTAHSLPPCTYEFMERLFLSRPRLLGTTVHSACPLLTAIHCF